MGSGPSASGKLFSVQTNGANIWIKNLHDSDIQVVADKKYGPDVVRVGQDQIKKSDMLTKSVSTEDRDNLIVDSKNKDHTWAYRFQAQPVDDPWLVKPEIITMWYVAGETYWTHRCPRIEVIQPYASLAEMLKTLAYKPEILRTGKVQESTYMKAKPASLELTFRANGHDCTDALIVSAHNRSSQTLSFEIPKGAVLQPTNRRDQNLVVKVSVHIEVGPGLTEEKRVHALCGNHNKHSPHCSMTPTNFVMAHDLLTSQTSLWSFTAKFELEA